MENKSKIAFLRRVFNGADVSRDGINLAVMCPNKECGSRKKSKRKLSIRIDTDQAHCWVCGLKTRNNLIPILRKIASTSDIQEYAEKFLASGSSRHFLDDSDTDVPQSIDFPSDFKLLGMHLDSVDPDIRSVLRYLRRRGLSDRDIWYFKLGVSNEYKFRRRVIIPSFDRDGYINFYTARSIDEEQYVKYMLPSGDKVEIVFNEMNIDWSQEITIVEGPFDLMKCDDNATCLQGSGLSEDYLLFWRIIQHKTPVLLALDADAKIKTRKYARLLADYAIPVRILELGSYSDVGEMSREEFLSYKKVSNPWERMSSLREKIKMMSMSSADSSYTF